jgi:hypothetical protein
MATTGTKPLTKTQFAVTLVIEGSRLETMSGRAKETFGDNLLRVEKVQKIAIPGEWTLTEERTDGTYRNKVWENTDGREIVWQKPYDEDGEQWGDDYTVRDLYGDIAKGLKTFEEAQAAVRPILTPQEIQSMADEIAFSVASLDDDDWEPPTDLANKYLSARRIERRYKDEDDEKKKAQSEYIVTMRIKGSTLPAVERRAKAAWGDKVKISHVRRNSSNADLLDDAQEHVEQAVEIIAELQEAMVERRDNTPENFQQTETYSAVEESADGLDALKDEVEGVISSFDNIEFPGW